MGKNLPTTLILLAALLFFASATEAQTRRQLTCGRVVDAQGKPVAQARVSLVGRRSSGRGNSIEELIPGVEADAAGRFCIETFLPASSPPVSPRLYVTSPISNNEVALVDVPFTRLRRRPVSFKGKPIDTLRKDRTDVGDVGVQVYYGRVLLKIEDRAGRPLLTSADDWQPVWFRVRDANGVAVYESGLSANDVGRAINLENSSINLALPEGVWFLEVAVNGVPPNVLPDAPKVSWLRIPRKLNVKAAGGPLEIVLKK